MKNNTKLIMETWRRFLKEEEESMSGKTPLPGEAPFEKEQPVSHDEHLGSSDPYNFSDLGPEESSYDDDYEDLPGDLPGDFETMHDEIDDLVRQGMPRNEIEAKYPQFSPAQLDAIYANFYDMQSLAAEERDELNDPDIDEFGNKQENPFADEDGPYWKLITMKYPKFYENSKLPVILSKFAPIDIWAITLGPWVFCRGELSERTKRHEAIHYLQYRELWFVGFLLVYLFDYLWAAIISKKGFSRDSYLAIRFEQEAWSCDDFEDYIEKRKKFAWAKYPLGGEKNEQQ